MIVTGGKIYERCGKCGQLVRLNKPIFGSLHICASESSELEDVPRPINRLSRRQLLGKDLGINLSDSETTHLHSLGLVQCDECCEAFDVRAVVKNPPGCWEEGDENFCLCCQCIPDVAEKVVRNHRNHPEWYAKTNIQTPEEPLP